MSKKKIIWSIFGVVAILVIGVGFYSYTNRSSNQQTSNDQGTTSYSAKKASSSTSLRSESAQTSSNSEALNRSSSTSNNVSTSSVNVKNLTNAQAVAWMKANMGTVLEVFNTTENEASNNNTTFTADDFSYEYSGHSGGWSGDADDGVYYAVHENHSTTNMQHAGADPETAPMACWFRITGNGELQLQLNADDGWQTVSTSYNG